MESDSCGVRPECPAWRNFRTGDPEALAALFNEHYDSLYHYGVKLFPDEELVKDCVQNLFVKIWASRSRLMAVQSVRPYLLKALRRHIGDQVVAMRRRRTFQEEGVDGFQVMFSHEDFLIANQISAEQSLILSESLNSLSARQREAIFLKFYEGLDYEKIAEVMTLNIQSVRNLIHQGLKNIKHHFDSRPSPVFVKVERKSNFL